MMNNIESFENTRKNIIDKILKIIYLEYIVRIKCIIEFNNEFHIYMYDELRPGNCKISINQDNEDISNSSIGIIYDNYDNLLNLKKILLNKSFDLIYKFYKLALIPFEKHYTLILYNDKYNIIDYANIPIEYLEKNIEDIVDDFVIFLNLKKLQIYSKMKEISKYIEGIEFDHYIKIKDNKSIFYE